MAIEFRSGFENDFGDWITQDNPAIVTSPVHSGLKAMHTSNMHMYAYRTGWNSKNLSVEFWMYLPKIPTGGGQDTLGFLQIRTASQSQFLAANFYNNTWEYMYVNGGGWNFAYATHPLTINQWHKVKTSISVDATNGELHVWVDDAEIITVLGINTAAYGNITYFLVGATYGGTAPLDAYFDDVTAIDETGGGNVTPTNYKFEGVSQLTWEQGYSDKILDLVQASKSNTVRMQTQIGTTDNPPTGYATWDDWYVDIASKIHARGLKLMLCCMGLGTYSMSETTAENNVCVEVVLNKQGKGDQWRAGWKHIIQITNADAISVMNEPGEMSASTYAGELSNDDWYLAYHDFLVQCIDDYRTVKPDLICVVQSSPYWKEAYRIIQNPIYRPNIVYGMHIYYGNWNPPGGWRPQFEHDYYGDGNLANAKANLESWLNSDAYGLSALQSLNATVLFEEAGTVLGEPNAERFMQDLYDIAKKYNVGVLQFTALKFGNIGAPRTTVNGILIDYGIEGTAALNSIGRTWYANMGGILPTDWLPIMLGLLGLGAVTYFVWKR